jgi:cobalamin biosynthetic protein CobC
VPLAHGGDLGAARLLFPDAPQPFVDLSTAINPHPYPVPSLSADVFARLPEPAALERLAAIAAETYGAPSGAHVVAAPGTQILLPSVAALLPPGRAAVLGPTYAEHVRAAVQAGHRVDEVGQLSVLRHADLAVVVNPNNPDGRVIERATLLDCARSLPAGGMLVVDEAFGEVAAAGTSLAGDVERGPIVVLRSFGKFFGLAGLRLGFALTNPATAMRLRAALGPWAVSGPALAIGTIALQDHAWAEATRSRLMQAALRLDALLAGSGLDIVGGTALFRLVQARSGVELFQHLGRAGLWVRRFAEAPDRLRFGLPGSEADWERLGAALVAFQAA